MDAIPLRSVEPPLPPEAPATVVPSLEREAGRIFGAEDSPTRRRWVDYWQRSIDRNRQLLEAFEAVIMLDLDQAQVLDVGCGTGGLSEVLAGRGSHYLGGDYHRHVLQFAPDRPGHRFVQLSALDLPVASGSQDVVFAFDVIEHLVGGMRWQARFLSEVRRVLSPSGVCLLTTPNFWYPWDAHTELYGPQFLPVAWADRYIGRRNPAFLDEHGSFSGIQLMRPATLRRMLREEGLAPLHRLPCALDPDDYRSIHPFLGLFTRLGLGWLPHAEFWMVVAREEAAERLRARLRKEWKYVHAQPETEAPDRFGPGLDFDRHPGGHQLLDGWHWHERGQRGYRWTTRRARCVLQTRDPIRRVVFSGFCPEDNRLEIRVEGKPVGDRMIDANRVFRGDYLVPFPRTGRRLLEVELRCARACANPVDARELGVMMFELGLQP